MPTTSRHAAPSGGTPSRHNIQFTDLSQIQLVSKTRMTRRGRKTDYELHCFNKAGSMEVVPVGTLMEEAGPEILRRAAARGVTIVDMTEQPR